MNTTIFNRRATFFVPDLNGLQSDDLPKLASIQSAYQLLPTTNKSFTFRMTPKGVEPSSMLSVDLRKDDDSLKIDFGLGRIDIIRSKVSENDDIDDSLDFVNIAMDIFSKLKGVFEWSTNRIALCCSILFDMNDEELKHSYSKIIGNTEDSPFEWKLRNVFSGKIENINEIEYNKVSSISRVNLQIPYESSPQERLLLEMDYNTRIGQIIPNNQEVLMCIYKFLNEEIHNHIDNTKHLLY